MSHLISDMGGELGEFVEAHGIRQYFTASEAPWQNGRLVECNSGIWKVASMMNWAKKKLTLTRLDIRQPTGSSVEHTNCHRYFWVGCKVAIDGVARSLA